MLNDARVASLGFFKDNICTTRINKEKKFKIKFQVLLKFAQILPDYNHIMSTISQFRLAKTLNTTVDFDTKVSMFLLLDLGAHCHSFPTSQSLPPTSFTKATHDGESETH